MVDINKVPQIAAAVSTTVLVVAILTYQGMKKKVYLPWWKVAFSTQGYNMVKALSIATPIGIITSSVVIGSLIFIIGCLRRRSINAISQVCGHAVCGVAAGARSSFHNVSQSVFGRAMACTRYGRSNVTAEASSTLTSSDCPVPTQRGAPPPQMPTQPSESSGPVARGTAMTSGPNNEYQTFQLTKEEWERLNLPFDDMTVQMCIKRSYKTEEIELERCVPQCASQAPKQDCVCERKRSYTDICKDYYVPQNECKEPTPKAEDCIQPGKEPTPLNLVDECGRPIPDPCGCLAKGLLYNGVANPCENDGVERFVQEFTPTEDRDGNMVYPNGGGSSFGPSSSLCPSTCTTVAQNECIPPPTGCTPTPPPECTPPPPECTPPPPECTPPPPECTPPPPACTPPPPACTPPPPACTPPPPDDCTPPPIDECATGDTLLYNGVVNPCDNDGVERFVQEFTPAETRDGKTVPPADGSTAAGSRAAGGGSFCPGSSAPVSQFPEEEDCEPHEEHIQHGYSVFTPGATSVKEEIRTPTPGADPMRETVDSFGGAQTASAGYDMQPDPCANDGVERFKHEFTPPEGPRGEAVTPGAGAGPGDDTGAYESSGAECTSGAPMMVVNPCANDGVERFVQEFTPLEDREGMLVAPSGPVVVAGGPGAPTSAPGAPTGAYSQRNSTFSQGGSLGSQGGSQGEYQAGMSQGSQGYASFGSGSQRTPTTNRGGTGFDDECEEDAPVPMAPADECEEPVVEESRPMDECEVRQSTRLRVTRQQSSNLDYSAHPVDDCEPVPVCIHNQEFPQQGQVGDSRWIKYCAALQAGTVQTQGNNFACTALMLLVFISSFLSAFYVAELNPSLTNSCIATTVRVVHSVNQVRLRMGISTSLALLIISAFAKCCFGCGPEIPTFQSPQYAQATSTALAISSPDSPVQS